jgi:6-phosphofructokinase 1
VSGCNANDFRDRWGLIHARPMHPSFYDPENLRVSEVGVRYLMPIFANAVGQDDMEAIRQTLFRSGNLTQPYHSVNVDVNKRICYLDE